MRGACASADGLCSADLRFRRGSARHAAAMERFPTCRALELAPLRHLLPDRRRVLLDLFAGTGFVSRAVGPYFQRVTAVDSGVLPSGNGQDRIEWRSGDATWAAATQVWLTADLAVCHAGFHHVLGPGGTTEADACRARRLDVLRLWRSKVATGGRLIIADVPSPSVPGSYAHAGPIDARDDVRGRSAAQRQSATTPESQLAELDQAPSLSAYLASAASLCTAYDLANAEPALFFDRFVDVHSPYGHVARFSTPQELAQLFLQAGLVDVAAFVAPTPWMFRSKDAACWFVHELLGIGRTCSSKNALPEEERTLIEHGLREHLNLRELPNGEWAVAWKLMYVMGVRE